MLTLTLVDAVYDTSDCNSSKPLGKCCGLLQRYMVCFNVS